jgi:hypothetical protein
MAIMVGGLEQDDHSLGASARQTIPLDINLTFSNTVTSPGVG